MLKKLEIISVSKFKDWNINFKEQGEGAETEYNIGGSVIIADSSTRKY